MKLIVLLFLGLALQAACFSETSRRAVPMPTVTVTSSALIVFDGTVKRIPLEGGFYGIVAKDGSKYNPVNLSKKFQKDDLKVRCQAVLSENQISIRMWGKIIEIKKIEKR